MVIPSTNENNKNYWFNSKPDKQEAMMKVSLAIMFELQIPHCWKMCKIGSIPYFNIESPVSNTLEL